MSQDLVTFEINGVEVQARPGSMVIEAADANGIQIPRFCYHKKLSVAANCRMCMVEVEKAPKPLPACATPVAEGMKVFTSSAIAIAAQQGTMEFLLINHPLDCPVCDQGGECELQDVAMEYGDDVSRYSETKRVVRDKNIGPLIATDMTRCIHCTRCVRFGEEIAGLREMGATGRGEFVEIGTYIEKAIDSEMSGNIIDLCPVGALTSKPSRFYGRPWELTQHGSIAGHDCVGSGITQHTRHNKIVRVVPRDTETINETWLSDRDRFAYQGLQADDRLLAPMIKYDDQWRKSSWEEALQYVTDKFRSIGGENIGALFSPNSTTEECYLGQKFLRGLGINAVDHRLRQTDFSDQEHMPLFPWLGTSIEALEQHNAVLLVGSNIRKDQPILGHRIRKAAMKGADVMSIDCMDYDFTFPLKQQLVTHPTAMVSALAGVCAAVLKKAGVEMPPQLSSVPASIKADKTQNAIAKTLLDAEESIILLGNLAASHPAAATLRALASVIADNSRIKFGMLTEGANAAGACLAGLLPNRVAAGKQAPVAGAHAAAMLEDNNIKAWFLWGVEPESDCWNPAQALEAVSAAEFVVAATPFASASMQQYAHVLLPIGAAGEISGTYVNTEGRWQSFRPAAESPGETRPGWKVLRVLGNLAKVSGFDYVSVEQVRDELKKQFAADLEFSNSMTIQSDYVVPKSSSKQLMRFSSVNNYRTDALLRRANALQQTADGKFDAVVMNSAEIKKQGLSGETEIEVAQDGRGLMMQLVVDDSVADGCAFIPAATESSSHLSGCFGPIEVKKS